MKKMLLFIMCFMMSSCSIAGYEGRIGKTKNRRLVVLGEYVAEDVATDYGQRYNAEVFYTPYEGEKIDGVGKLAKMSDKLSYAMRSLIKEFQSMSDTGRSWVIIVPHIAQKYVLVTLKNMKDNEVKGARGVFVYPESDMSDDILAKEVTRVFGEQFTVSMGESP